MEHKSPVLALSQVEQLSRSIKVSLDICMVLVIDRLFAVPDHSRVVYLLSCNHDVIFLGVKQCQVYIICVTDGFDKSILGEVAERSKAPA